MRKFKAWDKKWKRWVDPEDVTIWGDGSVCIDRRAKDGGDVIESCQDTNQFEIVWETGSEDVCGIPIYDGDIVQDIEVPGWVYAVYWSKYGWRMDALWTAGTVEMLRHDERNEHEYIVIGNRFENPELVK